MCFADRNKPVLGNGYVFLESVFAMSRTNVEEINSGLRILLKITTDKDKSMIYILVCVFVRVTHY